MKRLNLNPTPRWVEIDAELSVAVRPLSPFDLAEMFEGDEAWAPLVEAAGKGGGSGEDLARRMGAGALLDLIGRFAALVVADWTVCDDETGERLPVTAEAARAMLRAEPELAGPFLDRILGPALDGIKQLDAEKNASAPSPAGPTAGAETTARDATRSASSVPQG